MEWPGIPLPDWPDGDWDGAVDAGSDEKVFRLSEARIARRVKAAARAADLPRLGEFQLRQRADGHGPAHGDAARDVGAPSPAQLSPPALLPPCICP